MRRKIVGGLVLACLAGMATASEFQDTAQVVSVTPSYSEVNRPSQDCRYENVPVRGGRERGLGGAIIGGIAGGILGNQVGGGHGREAATAVGAVTGALVGDRIDNRDNEPRYREVEHCRTVDHWERVPQGYRVTYRYQGKTFTQMMSYDPGDTVRVRVSVIPQ